MGGGVAERWRPVVRGRNRGIFYFKVGYWALFPTTVRVADHGFLYWTPIAGIVSMMKCNC
jgi:hypothetical protein